MIKPPLPLFASLTLGVVANGAAAQASPAALSLQVYNADAGSFDVNAVLVSGKTDAVLIDTGFTQADAHRIAAMVLDSRKTLKTIYISQADPDFYFGAGVLKTCFEDADRERAHRKEDPRRYPPSSGVGAAIMPMRDRRSARSHEREHDQPRRPDA
jgi:glyoxylase-like metal-dependent hydrolase (beta-lactamase superfamily II)